MSDVQERIPNNLDLLCQSFSENCTKAEAADVITDLKRRNQVFKENDLYGTLKDLYKIGTIDEGDDLALLEGMAAKMQKQELLKSSIIEYKRSLPSKDDKLIGRRSDMQKVDEFFADERVHGLNLFGPSGVGKTALAKEIAKEFTKDSGSRQVLEFDLRKVTTMNNLYLFILYQLGLASTPRNMQEHSVMEGQIGNTLEYLQKYTLVTERKTILEFLEQLTSKTLLIFDNIEQEITTNDKNEFIGFIRDIESRVCHEGRHKFIVISTTAMDESLRRFVKPQSVDPLPNTISKEFLSKRSKVDMLKESGEDVQALSVIAAYCRHIPYLLQGAEQMMREGFSTPVQVLEKIETQMSKGVPEQYACIGALFDSISTDHLKQLAVKISVFQRPFSVSTALKIADISSDYDALIDLEILTKHKIITKIEVEGKTKYDLHSLFQEFVTSYLTREFPSYNVVYETTELRFAQHFSRKMITLAKHLDEDFVRMYSKMEKHRVNFDVMLNLTCTNKEIIEQLLPSTHSDASYALVVLLECLKGIQERRKLFETWADILENEGKFSTSANMRCWQSIQLADMEGTVSAERILQQAEECLNKAMMAPSSDPEQLKAGKGLLLFCSGKINYMKSANIVKSKNVRNGKLALINVALEKLEGALAIHTELYGDHSMTARTLNLQGNCFMEMEKLEMAGEVYRKALLMKIKLIGSEKHCEIAGLYSQLSQLHDKLGRREEEKMCSWMPGRKHLANEEYEAAAEWLRKALELDRELSLNDTLSSATFNRNLANVLIGLKRYDEALECAKESHKVRKRLLGEHPETVRILYLIGVIHEWRKDYHAALQSYEEAFKVEESLPLDNHSVVREMLCNRLEALCKEKEKIQEYKPRIKRIKEIKDTSAGPDDSKSTPQDETPMEESLATHITIDKHGGDYDLRHHGLFLTVPPGAVNDSTILAVQPLAENSLPTPAGDMEAVVSFIVSLGPSDVVLQKPIVVKLMHSGPTSTCYYENIAIAFNYNARTWEELPGECSHERKDYSSEFIQVQLTKLTTLAVITMLITDTFEVPVSGCVVRSSVCNDVTLHFPEGAVGRTIKGSMKVLPISDVMDINAYLSPIIVVDGFEEVKLSKPVTLRVPHPCPAGYPVGELHVLFFKDEEWTEIIETVESSEEKDSIELQINHFSMIWLVMGVVPPVSRLILLYKRLSAIAQDVCFAAFKLTESLSASDGSLKLTLWCIANHMQNRMAQLMEESLGERYEELARATGNAMRPNDIAYTKAEGDFKISHGKDIDLKFIGNEICSKELNICKKEGDYDHKGMTILTLYSNKERSGEPLGQLTVYARQLENAIKRKSQASPSSSAFPHPDPDSDEVYTMKSNPRGLIVIINIEKFTAGALTERKGSQKDVNDLVNLFCGYLNFEVRIITKLNRVELMNELNAISDNEEYGKYDCLAVCIMSHGNMDFFFAADEQKVKFSEVYTLFSKDIFRAKPKLFFIQACRGTMGGRTDCDGPNDNSQSASTAQADSNDPDMSDILMAYPSFEGYIAYRLPEDGSFFIQSLVRVFREYADKEHILEMLTRVNEEVHRRMHGYPGITQVPQPEFSLRKKLYFWPGMKFVS